MLVVAQTVGIRSESLDVFVDDARVTSVPVFPVVVIVETQALLFREGAALLTTVMSQASTLVTEAEVTEYLAGSELSTVVTVVPCSEVIFAPVEDRCATTKCAAPGSIVFDASAAIVLRRRGVLLDHIQASN